MVRVAIIGAGPRGLEYAGAFARTPGAELVLVCDPDERARERAQQAAPRVRVETKLSAALAEPGVDAVVLATPAASHADHARAALRAGKHVLVEPPLATRVADAEGVVAAARAADRTLMVAHLPLFHPAFEQLCTRVRGGGVGKVCYVDARRAGGDRDGSALWSLGPSEVAMVSYMLDARPESVSARGGCYRQRGVEDVVFVSLRFAGGALAQLQLSRIDPRAERSLTVVGDSDRIDLDDAGEGEALLRETTHFVTSLDNGIDPRTDAASALTVVRVLEAAQDSLAADGSPVAI